MAIWPFSRRAASTAVAKSGIANPSAWLLEAFGASRAAAGVVVTPATAVRASAVFACVRVISETIAALPLPVYKRSADGGRERDTGHPLYALLHDAPNDWQTAYEFRQAMAASMALYGNAYAEVVRGDRDRPEALIQLPTARVTVKVSADGVPVYEIRPGINEPGSARTLSAANVLHFRGPAFDGPVGLDMVFLAKEAIGLALASQDYGARFFANAARPSGVLEMPGHFATKEEASDFLDRWTAGFTGEKKHKTAVLPDGMTYKVISLTNEEAQFIESRKYQVGEIARLWRVPPHLIGDLERATFSNIEQQSIEFVTFTLQPYLVAIEQAIQRTLFMPSERATHFAEHLVEGLLRGDSQARANFYSRGILDGWLTRNEARRRENLPPLPKLDEPLQPLNMVPAGTPPAPKSPAPPPEAPKP